MKVWVVIHHPHHVDRVDSVWTVESAAQDRRRSFGASPEGYPYARVEAFETDPGLDRPLRSGVPCEPRRSWCLTDAIRVWEPTLLDRAEALLRSLRRGPED